MLLVTADLLGSSKIEAAAARQGVELETLARPDAVLRHANERPLRLVVIDLATPGIDLSELVQGLRSLDRPPAAIVAFGPHVLEAKLAAARDAGCDEVLTRGQFHAGMDDLFRRYAASS